MINIIPSFLRKKDKSSMTENCLDIEKITADSGSCSMCESCCMTSQSVCTVAIVSVK